MIQNRASLHIAVWITVLLLLVSSPVAKAQQYVFSQKYSAYNMPSAFFRNYTSTAIQFDRKGRIWVGTLNGLYVSNGNTIEQLPLADANDKIISSLLYSGGYMYVGTNEGINRIHEDSMKAHALRITDDKGQAIHNYCMVVRIGREQNLLFYTGYNRGAYYETNLSTGKNHFLFNESDGYRALKTGKDGTIQILWAVETTGLLEHHFSNGRISGRRYFIGQDNMPVLTIEEAVYDGRDTLWCATNKGLVGMDINTHLFRQISFPQYRAYELSDVKLAGRFIYCATKDAGIIQWDRQKNTAVQIAHQPDDPYSILSGNVSKMYLVAGKLLVAATTKGLSIIPLDANMQFVYKPVPNATVNALQKGKNIWLAGIGSSMYQFRPGSFESVDSIRLGNEEYVITARELPGLSWLVVTNSRVLHWSKGNLKQVRPKDGRHTRCESIVKQNDSTYFLSGQTGIYRWQLGGDHMSWMHHTDNEPYQWFNTVVPVGDSVLLANAYLSFIKAYTIHHDSVRPFRTFNTFSNVNDWIVFGNRSVLLAGTNGISYLDVGVDKIEFRDTNFHEQVFRIVLRAADTLLIGEKSVFRLKNGRVFPKADPFVNLLSVSSRDKLLVDGNNIWSVNGADLTRTPLHATVDKLLYFHLHTFYGDRMDADDIRLPANDNLQLTVRSVCYLPYVRYRVQYRLSGIDKSWTDLDGENIRYTQLQPGTYMLTVQAMAGTQTLYHKQIRIVAVPAWYQTIWAYLVFALLLIAVVMLIFKWRVGNIRRKADEALALQRQMNELENKALRAQMNPHFLFNTLNSINHYILNNNTNEASHYLTRFSKLVRLVLDNSRREWISLERELEALNIYLELEMMRRNNEFDYSIAIRKEVDASSFMVPPLILQPFVENAIWHGLATIASGGFIEITVEEQGDDGVCIRIEDNGIGYNPGADVAKKKDHNSFGMDGTRDRLELMHPDNKYTIEALHDETGKMRGTRVSIYIYND